MGGAPVGWNAHGGFSFARGCILGGRVVWLDVLFILGHPGEFFGAVFSGFWFERAVPDIGDHLNPYGVTSSD